MQVLLCTHPNIQMQSECLSYLKIRHSDTSCVQQQVRDDNLALRDKIIMGIRSNGSIGGFTNDLGLDLLDVLESDLTFEGGRDQDIALAFHDRDGFLNDLDVAVSAEGALLVSVLKDRLDVDSVGVVC